MDMITNKTRIAALRKGLPKSTELNQLFLNHDDNNNNNNNLKRSRITPINQKTLLEIVRNERVDLLNELSRNHQW